MRVSDRIIPPLIVATWRRIRHSVAPTRARGACSSRILIIMIINMMNLMMIIIVTIIIVRLTIIIVIIGCSSRACKLSTPI